MVWVIATFYKFAPLSEPGALRVELLEQCLGWGLRGTILLAPEGLNATVAGARDGIDRCLTWLQTHPEIGPFPHQESITAEAPFERMKVKLKKEIVTLGRPDINPAQQEVGTYVDPRNWNQIITDPDVVVIDARNDFEVELGTFKGAVNPQTHSFRDLPDYVATHLDPTQHKKVAMFCTGGIRCEKATAYLRSHGFDQVYHLKGGILNYLKTVPKEVSLWQGDCFVFDDRVAVDHHLQPTEHALCLGCGYPVSPTEQASPHYQVGISCPHCYAALTPAKQARLEARQRDRCPPFLAAKIQNPKTLGSPCLLPTNRSNHSNRSPMAPPMASPTGVWSPSTAGEPMPPTWWG
ncbi:rhodanese-related sulfurtransferase [Nodosilinea sp. LEGE 07088]|uniref:oxygen-dependent tRNA uridine(34) hydroxylase TrhO n=1 Tax=Nodosilinea sp. LEGE 07088 TaxID=2777968 RepID=UPI0018807F64|nr:rhodanese-related sulfurtransferase [Nodosilinea sp. LEGE 07088]MBE9139414.1 rhodanese-related sulfurtransferase [Nodosilinea sp. LEGE 07088]